MVRKPGLCEMEVTSHNGVRILRQKDMSRGKVYRGIDRCRWLDVASVRSAPLQYSAEIVNVVERVSLVDTGFFGIDLATNHAEVDLLMRVDEFCRMNEIIAISSDELSLDFGSFYSYQSIQWLGYDYFAPGEWSLIKESLFASSSLVENWFSLLNQNGLFDSPGYLDKFVAAYEEASEREKVEPIAGISGGLPPIAIRVGAIGYASP